MELLLVALGVIAAVSLVAHVTASSIAYFLLKDEQTILQRLFSFPTQMPARVGLLKLRYVFSPVQRGTEPPLPHSASMWVRLARYSGLTGCCAFVLFFAVAVLVEGRLR